MVEYRFPVASSKDPEEARFGALLSTYINDNPDPVFIETLKELGWVRKSDRVLQNKREVDKFISEHGYQPSRTSKNSKERKLGTLFHSYYEASGSYDQSLVEKYKDVPTWNEYKARQNKQELDNFINAHRYLPSQVSKDPVEKRLGQLFNNYNCEARGSYDQSLVEKYKDVPTWNEYRILKTKQELDTFIKERGHKPNTKSKDPNERKLGQLFNHYNCEASGSYDPEIIAKYKDVPTLKRYRGIQRAKRGSV